MVAKSEITDELKQTSEKEVIYNSEEIKKLTIKVKPTKNKKCERCWQRKPEVGSLEIPELCQRCYEVVKFINYK